MELLNLKGALSSLLVSCLEAASRNLSRWKTSVLAQEQNTWISWILCPYTSSADSKSIYFHKWWTVGEELFSGDSFCHLEPGPISLTPKNCLSSDT